MNEMMIELAHNEEGFIVSSKNKSLDKFLNELKITYDVESEVYDVTLKKLYSNQIKIPTSKKYKNVYHKDRFILVDFEETEDNILKTIWELWKKYNEQIEELESELKGITKKVIIFNSDNNTTLIK